MKQFIYLIVFLFSFLGIAQNNALFEQGKQSYKAEKHQDAIGHWMKIIKDGEHSAAVYFNIANAHYKLNNIGPSIYYYEKALQLSPNDKSVLNNLAFAQNATVDAIEPLPESVFYKWDKRISGLLTYNGWAWVAVISVLMFTVLFLKYYFSVFTRNKRIYFVGAILSVLVFAMGLSLAFRNYNQHLNDKPAIIFAESSDIKSEPTLGSETAFILHEGTKVQILAEDDAWYRVQIADGKEGWIPASDLKAL